MNFNIKKLLNKLIGNNANSNASDIIQEQILSEYGISSSLSNQENEDKAFISEGNDILPEESQPAARLEKEQEEFSSFEKQEIPEMVSDDQKDTIDKISISSPQKTEEDKSCTEMSSIEFEADNANIKAITKLVELINEFDQYKLSISNEDTKQVIQLMQDRLISTSESLGANLIKNEGNFNNYRHIAYPLSIIEDGVAISATIRSGIEINNIVLLKALVEI